MILALTSQNQDLAWRLESQYFKRLGVIRRSVSTGREICSLALELCPQLIIVDWELPDMDGFDLCEMLRAKQELSQVRILVAVRREHVSQQVLRRAERAGAHNVIAYPLSDQELFDHLSQVLALPRRLGRRLPVNLDVGLEGPTGTFQGEITDLGIHGARVQLKGVCQKDINRMRAVKLQLRRRKNTRPVTIGAQVVWQGSAPQDEEVSLGLEFEDLGSGIRAAIAEMAFWELSKTEPARVFFNGDLTEDTEFGDLPERLSVSADFDLSGLRYINSTGIVSWLYFLDSIRHLKSYSFSCCSPSFMLQARLVPQMMGEAKILSLMVPFFCEECRRELLELVELDGAFEVENLVDRKTRCPDCNTSMTLDEDPKHLLAGLPGSRTDSMVS